jgi:methanogenic corrinoid protein MtbC1
MTKLRPIMEKGAGGTGDIMVIGTVEGDQHNVGKRVVSAAVLQGDSSSSHRSRD